MNRINYNKKPVYDSKNLIAGSGGISGKQILIGQQSTTNSNKKLINALPKIPVITTKSKNKEGDSTKNICCYLKHLHRCDVSNNFSIGQFLFTSKLHHIFSYVWEHMKEILFLRGAVW